MTPKGKERLLKLANILDVADARHREAKEPTYRQTSMIHPCGTPACAIGHWAVNNPRRLKLLRSGGNIYIQWRGDEGDELPSIEEIATQEFDITELQGTELFDWDGCSSAATAKQAAAYIRKFVARVEREQSAAVEAYRKRIENGEIDPLEAA